MLPPPPKPFLSIILPTYNRANSIGKMIDSVLDQSFEDFELIIVDDGSTDTTQELLKSYIDSRIRIFSQSNGGVSSARNLGILKARGEYITFVDSDDYLLEGFFGDIYHCVKQYHSDILLYPMRVLTCKTTHRGHLFGAKIKYCDKYGCYIGGKKLFEDFCRFSGNSGACSKVFRRELVIENNIFYPEHIAYGEDIVFNLKSYFFAKDVYLSEEEFYVYETSTQSLRYKTKGSYWQIENILLAHKEMREFLVQYNAKDLSAFINANTINHIYSRFLLTFWRNSRVNVDQKVYTLCLSESVFEKKLMRIKLKILGSKFPKRIKLSLLYSIFLTSFVKKLLWNLLGFQKK